MSSSLAPPLPPSDSFLSAVTQHPSWSLQDFGISINDTAIQQLLTSPSFRDTFHRLISAPVLSFPLNFPTTVSEVNVISITSLLNFASGYRLPLRRATGRGAWDNMRFLVMSLFMESNPGDNLLSAKGMQSIDENRVANLLGISLHTEKSHPTIPGLTVGEPGGPLYELVSMIKSVLTETGAILEMNGYPDLGTFVLQAFKDGAAQPDRFLDAVLERLVTALPAMQDMAIVEGRS